MSGTFYNNSTFVAIVILVLVLLLIAGLLVGVMRMVRGMIQEKYPEEVKPGWYERVVKSKTKDWNPTIVTLVVIAIMVLVLGGWGYNYGMTEVGVQQDYSPDQPIAYSHELHAGKMGIDCQYCHTTASLSRHASIPSLNTCMNCHKGAQLRDKYNGQPSPELMKIYKAVGFDPETSTYDPNAKKTPIKWVRIHNLPDLAYFNHSQHVAVGKVECQVCHGPIQEMEKVYQFSTLQMGWCINCHRQRGIDVNEDDNGKYIGNKYYEQVHEEMKKKGEHYVTVAQNGGLECAKCHY
ncbi:MAG: hypothetical protein GC181_01880 [Bacteroidetes bacterium]|nr:hypothetical protein [Bacteroidota bacterium]